MVRVAGVDGTPGGWAVVLKEEGRWRVLRIVGLSQIVDSGARLDIVAVDVPIGLCDAYQVGGRACDREARKQLRKRASSVFPAPVRSVLDALLIRRCVLSVEGQRAQWQGNKQASLRYLGEDQRG
jgi:predicted RNase H-like nuclease